MKTSTVKEGALSAAVTKATDGMYIAGSSLYSVRESADGNAGLCSL